MTEDSQGLLGEGPEDEEKDASCDVKRMILQGLSSRPTATFADVPRGRGGQVGERGQEGGRVRHEREGSTTDPKGLFGVVAKVLGRWDGRTARLALTWRKVRVDVPASQRPSTFGRRRNVSSGRRSRRSEGRSPCSERGCPYFERRSPYSVRASRSAWSLEGKGSTSSNLEHRRCLSSHSGGRRSERGSRC